MKAYGGSPPPFDQPGILVALLKSKTVGGCEGGEGGQGGERGEEGGEGGGEGGVGGGGGKGDGGGKE